MSLTAALREELAHLSPGDPCCRAAEASALLRLGGSLHLGRGGLRHVTAAPAAAVARRLHALLVELTGERPELGMARAGGLRAASTWHVTVPTSAVGGLARLGIVDADGRPVDGILPQVVARGCDAAAYLRGALMVAGSASDPLRPPHLEVRAPGAATAGDLVALLDRIGAPGARATEHGDGWRVVLKSGEAIGALLATTGAHTAYLAFDQGRLRRELRGEANRVANADQANVARAVAASARQVADIERALEQVDWDALPDDLRHVALARLANPEASLAELGALLDPPIGKVAVHRRLARLRALGSVAANNGAAADGAPGAGGGRAQPPPPAR